MSVSQEYRDALKEIDELRADVSLLEDEVKAAGTRSGLFNAVDCMEGIVRAEYRAEVSRLNEAGKRLAGWVRTSYNSHVEYEECPCVELMDALAACPKEWRLP